MSAHTKSLLAAATLTIATSLATALLATAARTTAAQVVTSPRFVAESTYTVHARDSLALELRSQIDGLRATVNAAAAEGHDTNLRVREMWCAGKPVGCR